jgi:inhibitor of cysteine peptidase
MKKILSLLFIFTFIISACKANRPLKITDPAQAIEVNTGDEFTIVIESNPTTGYHWEIMGELSNVEFVSKDYQAEEPIATGSGGVDMWTFKAISTGEAQITLGYYPPYEDPEPPQQTITFVVKVK